MFKQFIISLAVICSVAPCFGQEQRNRAAKKDVTLMGVLSEWMYPGASFGGAEMSDGGNRTIQSARCQAILTTGDSFEKVTSFYERKLVSGRKQADKRPGDGQAQSVSIQDASLKRPVQLRVIVVNRASSSTTLVISRTVDESKTSIAWSHFERLTD